MSQVRPCWLLRKPLDIFLEMTYIPQGFLNRFDRFFTTAHISITRPTDIPFLNSLVART
jgi:hypothetical protein